MTLETDLRAWAKGDYCYEAAIELLLRGFRGRFTESDSPWMRPGGPGRKCSVDFASIPEHIRDRTEGEQHFLLFSPHPWLRVYPLAWETSCLDCGGSV